MNAKMKNLISITLIILLLLCLPPVASSDSGKLIIVSWGGSYMEAQKQAYFDPFSKATGIDIITDTGPQIARSKAEVESGRPSYDTTATNQAFYQIGVEENLWVPIEYKYFDPKDLKAMKDEVKLKYGVGTIYYSEGMAINLEAFPNSSTQPNTWADVWNVKKFPGKRALPYPDVASYPLPEAALLADGVPPEELYPLDIARAVKKLKEIVPHTIFWKDINQAGQLLASGESVISMAPSGRVQQLIDKGAPIKIVWNQARYTFDLWYVLKGAPNVDNALKFISCSIASCSQN
jgi:putative spermidine/putrescine transport system substrate-binding protein